VFFLMYAVGFSIYVLIAVLATWVVSRIPTTVKWRRRARLLSIVTFMLIPIWDIIPGRLYFHFLCATEAGLTVYRTVELPEEHWNPDGTVKVVRMNKWPHKRLIGGKYVVELLPGSRIVPLFRIVKRTWRIRDVNTDQIIAERIDLEYWGGWLANNVLPHVTPVSCSQSDVPAYSDVYPQIFTRP
jgi:hypothetical protein